MGLAAKLLRVICVVAVGVGFTGGVQAEPEAPRWLLGTWEAREGAGKMVLELKGGLDFSMTMTRGAQSRSLDGSFEVSQDTLTLKPMRAPPGADHTMTPGPEKNTLRLRGPMFGGQEVELVRISEPFLEESSLAPPLQPAASASASAYVEVSDSFPPGLAGRWTWKEEGAFVDLVIDAAGSLRMNHGADGYSMALEKKFLVTPGKLILLPEYEFLSKDEAPFELDGDALVITIEGTRMVLAREASKAAE